jgi:hypothetical protein
MVLNIVALLLVLGITFLHSTFGFFSGIINLLCCVTALAVAFGFYEPLNGLLTGQVHLHSGFTEPAALVLLFALSYFVLRYLADTFIRGNVRVPMYLDWAGGAVCGFLAAQLCVGVLAIGFLMLPWGDRVMMFSRFERDPENQTYRQADDIPAEYRLQDERIAFRRNHLWLRSDEFATGLFSLLSRGSLKGQTTFASVYPSFADWVFWSGNTIQPESLTAPLRDAKDDGFADGLKVDAWWEQTERLTQDELRYRRGVPRRGADRPPYEPFDYQVQPGRKLLGVRLSLLRAAADRDNKSAYHRFRPSMIRLVGDVRRPDGSTEPRHYIPQIIGGVDPNLGSYLRVVELDNNFGVDASGNPRLDAYFEVDDGFEPRFVEYRRHARAAMTTAQLAKSPPGDRLAAAGATPGPPGRDRATGAARFIDTANRQFTGERDRLPFVMRLDRLRPMLDVQLDGLAIAAGRLTGDRSSLEAPEREADQNVTRFKVPEGRRIFQLQTRPRRASSLLGQAMDFAGGVTNQYQAFDETGNGYPLVGYYAITKKGDQDYVELVYLPDDPSFRGMLDFRDAAVRRALQDQDDAVLGLLFLVPPGKGIVAVGSQGGRIDFGETLKVSP